jgi:hypothetical protein
MRVMGEAKHRIRRYGRRLLLVLAGLAVVPLIFEVVFRVTHFSPLIERHPCSPGANHSQYLFMPEEGIHYTLRPYYEGEDVNPDGDFRVPVVINALGLRDRSLRASVCRDCDRVVTLGDSMTYGEGVRYEQAYPALLEAMLQHNRGRPVQVLNAGVPGYSLNQSFLRLQKYYDRLQPGTVTVCWSPVTFNREADEFVYLNGYLIINQETDHLYPIGNNLFRSIVPANSGRPQNDLWLQSHSFFYYYFKNGLLIAYPQRVIMGRFFNLDKFEIPPAYLIKPLNTIAQMNDFCRGRGSRLALIVLLSTPQSMEYIYPFCRDKGIPVISLAERGLSKDSPYQSMFFPHDKHPNAKGHQYLAESLEPLVQQLLTESPNPNP